MAENRVIGRNGEVPWHLPDDLRYLKELTIGHTVVMGRKTFDTIRQRPLPHRRNIILSRDPSFRAAGAEIVDSLDRALALEDADAEVFILGGAEIYRLALPIARRIYLTVVHAEMEGDARFPEFDLAEWRLISQRHHDVDERHRFAFSFRVYERKVRR